MQETSDLDGMIQNGSSSPYTTATLYGVFRKWCRSEPHDGVVNSPPYLTKALSCAIASQAKIGVHLLSRGVVSTRWTAAAELESPGNGEQWARNVVAAVMEYVRGVWDARNKQLHNGENTNQDMNDAILNNEIEKVYRQGVAALPGNQYFQVRLSDLLSDKRRKTKWLAMATVLVDAEHLHDNGQQSLYRYFRSAPR